LTRYDGTRGTDKKGNKGPTKQLELEIITEAGEKNYILEYITWV
jgi:hypothetical protein